MKGLIGYMEKKKLLARRAETILQNLRLRTPGLPQTALDMAKIQHNKVCPPDHLLLLQQCGTWALPSLSADQYPKSLVIALIKLRMSIGNRNDNTDALRIFINHISF